MIVEIGIKCPRCGSKDYIFAGWGWRKDPISGISVKCVHRCRCRDCGKLYSMPKEVREDEK